MNTILLLAVNILLFLIYTKDKKLIKKRVIERHYDVSSDYTSKQWTGFTFWYAKSTGKIIRFRKNPYTTTAKYIPDYHCKCPEPPKE